MESTGQPGRVHISEKTYQFLTEDYYVQQADDYNGKSALIPINPCHRWPRRDPPFFSVVIFGSNTPSSPPPPPPSYLGLPGSPPLLPLPLSSLCVAGAAVPGGWKGGKGLKYDGSKSPGPLPIYSLCPLPQLS
jgi:hypothetical protein